MSKEFVCPTHFTEDDYSRYSEDEMQDKATFFLKTGHIHVQRWNFNTFICTRRICINRQREHDKFYNNSNSEKYVICKKNGCTRKILKSFV